MIKKCIVLFILAFVANMNCTCLTAQVRFEEGKTVVVSHRGDWRNAPENSIQAIQNCIDMGVNMVEIDIKKTKDNVLILMHDQTLDRTTSGKGRPEDYTLAELKQLRLKNGAGVLTTHTIPTLEEAMLVVKGKIWVNIDKGYDFFADVKKVLEKTQTTQQVIIKSGLPFETVNEENKEVVKDLYFMPIVDANRPNAVTFVEDYIKNLHPQAFEVCFQKKDAQVEKVLNLIQTSGAKVWINTLWPSLCGGLNDDRAVENNEKDQTWGEVLKMGASFIQTDRPKELIEYLRLNNKFINNSGYVRKNLLDRNQSYVHVVAHRGDWKHFPENSLDAINSIIEMGGDVVEIDVQRTKDGVLILMHDETLDRTTNGHGIIAETMFSDIQKLNLKDYEGKLTNYKVPTLKEALLLAQGRIMLNLDKSDRFFNQVIDLLKETGTLDIAIMKGLHPLADVQTKFGKYLDDVIYMPMIRLDNKGAEDAMVEFVDGMSPVAFELGFNEVTNPLPKKAVRLINYQSLIWYNSLKGRNGGHDDVISLENPDAGFGYLIDELGARMIQTDEPQKLIEYLKRRGLH